MENHSLDSILQFAYPPLSAYEFDNLRTDKDIQNALESSVLYIIARRPLIQFCDYKINLDSKEDNENIQALKALMNKSYNIAFLKATIDTDLTEYLSLGGVEND